MANERVSQLNELLASELQTNDLFLMTDMSVRESKKMDLGSLILFLQSSASFNAIHAQDCISASYVPGSGVDGIVKSASYAITTGTCISASYSLRSTSSSYADRALSASWAPGTTIPDTASYSLKSGYADNAGVAYFLFYNGQPNGTASWAMNASYALNTGHTANADTASYLQYSVFVNGTSSYALNSNSASYAQTASWAPSIASMVKAFAEVTWSNSILAPRATVQSNISSITYLGQFTHTTYSPTYTYAWICSNLGVVFSTPLSNASYTVIGTVSQPYDFTERGLVAIHPETRFSSKTVNGFTMSMITHFDDDYWTNIEGGTQENTEVTVMTFMVLGA